MVKLVVASFVIALTPVVLDLAWRLAAGIGDWIGQTPAAAGEAKPWESTLSVKRMRASSCLSVPAAVPGPGAAQSWA